MGLLSHRICCIALLDLFLLVAAAATFNLAFAAAYRSFGQLFLSMWRINFYIEYGTNHFCGDAARHG